MSGVAHQVNSAATDLAGGAVRPAEATNKAVDTLS
jgi:hypothetical protein